MAAYIQPVKKHKGYTIYRSAATHPGARTRALLVFITDIDCKRFRYIVGNPNSFTQALLACIKLINKQTAPATDTDIPI